MIAGIREEIEELYKDVLEKIDVMVFGEFEGTRELEIVTLLEVLRGLEVEEVITLATGDKGLIVPAWRWKSLEGDVEAIKWALMPYLVKGKLEVLLWFQSPHPKGGVPDIMLSKPPATLKGNTFFFSEKAAWVLKGSKAIPMDWEPCMVIEVKRSARQAKPYPAKSRIMVAEEVRDVPGWKVMSIEDLSSSVVDELKPCL